VTLVPNDLSGKEMRGIKHVLLSLLVLCLLQSSLLSSQTARIELARDLTFQSSDSQKIQVAAKNELSTVCLDDITYYTGNVTWNGEFDVGGHTIIENSTFTIVNSPADVSISVGAIGILEIRNSIVRILGKSYWKYINIGGSLALFNSTLLDRTEIDVYPDYPSWINIEICNSSIDTIFAFGETNTTINICNSTFNEIDFIGPPVSGTHTITSFAEVPQLSVTNSSGDAIYW